MHEKESRQPCHLNTSHAAGACNGRLDCNSLKHRNPCSRTSRPSCMMIARLSQFTGSMLTENRSIVAPLDPASVHPCSRHFCGPLTGCLGGIGSPAPPTGAVAASAAPPGALCYCSNGSAAQLPCPPYPKRHFRRLHEFQVPCINAAMRQTVMRRI